MKGNRLLGVPRRRARIPGGSLETLIPTTALSGLTLSSSDDRITDTISLIQKV